MSAKRTLVRSTLRGLFRIKSPKEIVNALIRKPVLGILEMLGRWCLTIPVAAGERPVLVLTFREDEGGNIHTNIAEAAVMGNVVRVARRFDPAALLNEYADQLQPDELVHSLSLSIVPLESGEVDDHEDEKADNNNRESIMDRLIASAPQDKN